MELRQLRYFLMASRTCNFTQAAARCFTSRQNLTRAIHDLESELGSELFSLSGGAPVLTRDGERAARLAQSIVDQADALQCLFAAPDAASNTAAPPLSVACEVNMRYSADCVFDLIRSFPRCSVSIDEHTAATCYEMVVQGSVDMAFVYCLTRSFPECESVLLGSSPLRVLVREGSPLAEKSHIAMSDLGGHDLLLVPDASFVYERFMRVYDDCGLDRRRFRSVVDFSLMTERLRSEDAVAMVSQTFPEKIPQGIVSIPFEDIGCAWSMYALFRRDSDRKADIQELIEFIGKNVPPALR